MVGWVLRGSGARNGTASAAGPRFGQDITRCPSLSTTSNRPRPMPLVSTLVGLPSALITAARFSAFWAAIWPAWAATLISSRWTNQAAPALSVIPVASAAATATRNRVENLITGRHDSIAGAAHGDDGLAADLSTQRADVDLDEV